jgi:transcription initiation factor TFIID subunit 2/histone acetyltransferase MYST3
LVAEFGGASIQCTEDAGLAFVNVSQLSMFNIVIDRCGFTGVDIENTLNLVKNIVNVFYAIPEIVKIAMLLGHCEDVTLENVTIMNTRGFGLVGINVIGSSQLNSVLFFNNTYPGTCVSPYVLGLFPTKSIDFDSRNRLGGAAAFMYFDYHNQILHRGSQFTLRIQNSNFTFNLECSVVFLNLLRRPGRGESSYITNTGYRLGGSGALSLALAQLHYGIDVIVKESTFNTNHGTRGGGALISLFTGVCNTHVIFDGCLFERSAVAFFNDIRLPQAIAYTPYPPNRNTTISILNSNFTNNVAQGLNSTLILFSNYYSAVNRISEVVHIYINKCNFKENRAFVGSAIIIYERKFNGLDVGMQVSIKDTDFINNEIINADQDAIVTISQSAGTIDIRNVNLTFSGNCSFIDNLGTGIRAESSVIGVNGSVIFLRNIGIYGGALYLVEYSYLIMNSNSSIYFIENEARIEGGAVYVNENGLNSHLIGGFIDCFIHFAYDNFILCENCSDLESFGTYIQFSGNRAPSTGRMVSGSALSTCPWAFGVLNRSTNPDKSLFEILSEEYSSVFSFDEVPDNPTLVRSASARLEIKHLDSYESNITQVFPGQVFYVNISAIDDFENTVSNVVAAFASSDTPTNSNGTSIMPHLGSNRFAVLEENKPTTIPVKITGKESQNVSLVIYSTDTAGRAQDHIDIELFSCGFGFQFDSEEGICVCDPRLTQHGIICNNSRELIVPNGIWIGPFIRMRRIVTVHQCIYGYCRAGKKLISVQTPNDNKINFDIQCNPDMNRAGFVCGSCRAGYNSAVLGSRRCRQCSNWYILLFPVFLVIGIFAILLITHLNVTITAGFINGAIFYSNIVSIYDSILVPGGTLTNGAIALVSFPTLNLGFETCLHDKMTALEKVWWQLSFPLYLFLLMGLTTCLVRKKCLKVKQSTGFNTIQAFATLLILCYVSILEACIELISPRGISTIDGRYHVQWTSDPSLDYFGARHGVLGFFACLIILLYVIPLPILLLFPSVLYKSRYFSKFKPIYDAFWDPFKPNYRFFLGFRLILRWIPFAMATNVRAPINVFITNILLVLLVILQISIQPFENKWVNFIDTIFVLNLVLLFSGSLFFWSEYNSMDRDTITYYSRIYSSIIIIFGVLIMLGIFIYHTVIRFPKLKAFIERLLKDPTLLVHCHRMKKNAQSDTTVATEQESQDQQTYRPEILQVTVLREPLLESGVVELSRISPHPK